MATQSVTFVLFDGFAALDAVGPADVLYTANQMAQRDFYALRYVATAAKVRASNGMLFEAQRLNASLPPRSGTLFVPGADEAPLRAALANRPLLRWLAAAAKASRRTCSVCSGAFLLADVGLLDGRRATTHWRGLALLQGARQRLRVDARALYVEDRGVWTSAGVTAGIDMALALVERDLGQRIAMQVAREMVLFLVRPGGQAQFSAPLDLQEKALHSDLRALPPWLEARLAKRVSVAAMAQALAMSERTFHRRCLAVFGLTPLAVLHRLRLERVRALLADTSLSLKAVAAQAGFSDAGAMGKALKAQFGVTPLQYRGRFGRATASAFEQG